MELGESIGDLVVNEYMLTSMLEITNLVIVIGESVALAGSAFN